MQAIPESRQDADSAVRTSSLLVLQESCEDAGLMPDHVTLEGQAPGLRLPESRTAQTPGGKCLADLDEHKADHDNMFTSNAKNHSQDGQNPEEAAAEAHRDSPKAQAVDIEADNLSAVDLATCPPSEHPTRSEAAFCDTQDRAAENANNLPIFHAASRTHASALQSACPQPMETDIANLQTAACDEETEGIFISYVCFFALSMAEQEVPSHTVLDL